MHEKVSIRSALKSLFLNGKNGDRHKSMLNDPLRKLIPRVALPSIISMLVGAIYSMADTFFVGKLGNSATGAVGIVFPIMNLLQALSFIFAHGTSSYVSRLLGMGETERASRTVNTALVLAILTGVLYGTF
ncbi:MAG TPA: MATE family efflux transporter, partial [Clostridia bacterium]|nr:MATE family efflux transporter [Clostridia bacterium]